MDEPVYYRQVIPSWINTATDNLNKPKHNLKQTINEM